MQLSCPKCNQSLAAQESMNCQHCGHSLEKFYAEIRQGNTRWVAKGFVQQILLILLGLTAAKIADWLGQGMWVVIATGVIAVIVGFLLHGVINWFRHKNDPPGLNLK